MASFMDNVPFELTGSSLDMDMTMNTTNLMQVSNPSSAASSVPNTDEEDDENVDKLQAYKERRREAHTQAEKKRRDAIRKGYEDLQALVPNCSSPSDMGAQKLSKAVVLQRSLSYIEFLQQQQKKQADELSKLRKEKMALTILKENYERILREQQSSHNLAGGVVSEEVKFHIFKELMEKMFQSFNATVSTNDFQELSHGVINWIEEQCKPQSLRTALNEVLLPMRNQRLL
uniref:TF4 n=1 Tax=Phallusia mammillata TaxID=59560 RepID=A0A6F9DLG7_9ASCI|nr:TF4 [Phallusia mammillata]